MVIKIFMHSYIKCIYFHKIFLLNVCTLHIFLDVMFKRITFDLIIGYSNNLENLKNLKIQENKFFI